MANSPIQSPKDSNESLTPDVRKRIELILSELQIHQADLEKPAWNCDAAVLAEGQRLIAHVVEAAEKVRAALNKTT